MGAFDLSGISWAIVGGESGPGARPMKREWVISVRDQCRKQHVPFFFKQWGGVESQERQDAAIAPMMKSDAIEWFRGKLGCLCPEILNSFA